MSEKPKFKNAKELSDYLEELYKDADMMEDDQRILRYERLGIENKELHKNPEFRANWEEKQKAGAQKNADSAEWQEKHKLAMQKLADSAEWREKNKLANQKKADDPEWRENVTLANQKKALDPEWQENNRLGAQKRANDPVWKEKQQVGSRKRSDDPKWQENNRMVREKMYADLEWQEKTRVKNKKIFSKLISCDGVIYPSHNDASFSLAPVTRLTTHSKLTWLRNQIKKYPERYFYVDETGNKIEEPVEEPVDPKSIDSTYMSLEERKALAKLKRQQDDADK
jgi:hypothetical protein